MNVKAPPSWQKDFDDFWSWYYVANDIDVMDNAYAIAKACEAALRCPNPKPLLDSLVGL